MRAGTTGATLRRAPIVLRSGLAARAPRELPVADPGTGATPTPKVRARVPEPVKVSGRVSAVPHPTTVTHREREVRGESGGTEGPGFRGRNTPEGTAISLKKGVGADPTSVGVRRNRNTSDDREPVVPGVTTESMVR